MALWHRPRPPPHRGGLAGRAGAVRRATGAAWNGLGLTEIAAYVSGTYRVRRVLIFAGLLWMTSIAAAYVAWFGVSLMRDQGLYDPGYLGGIIICHLMSLLQQKHWAYVHLRSSRGTGPYCREN